MSNNSIAKYQNFLLSNRGRKSCEQIKIKESGVFNEKHTLKIFKPIKKNNNDVNNLLIF